MQATARTTPALRQAAAEGKALYETSCITCHGRNAQGVPDRGPSLIGVGSAAVEFQVGTGRMPLARQEAQAERKTPQFTHDEARQIGAYIQALGGGPELPPRARTWPPAATWPTAASCSGSTARRATPSAAAVARSRRASPPRRWRTSTDRDIYAAMLTGPQNMPVFGDNQLSPEEKRDIIAYIQNLQNDPDPGGWGIGRLGPVTEGLAIFLIGMVALVFTTLWIAGKS